MKVRYTNANQSRICQTVSVYLLRLFYRIYRASWFIFSSLGDPGEGEMRRLSRG